MKSDMEQAREVNGSQYAPSVLGNARRIEWEGDFPADLREITEAVFAPLEIVIPTWCQTVVFRNAPYMHDKTLQIEMSLRNRWILIKVSGDWFAHPHAERQCSMIHEIVHALLEPFSWHVNRMMDAYGPEEDTPERKFLNQTISDGWEQAVEDTARAMQKLLHLLPSAPSPP